MHEPKGPGRPHPIAVELAGWPELPTRLVELHTDDGTGHCRLCSAGTQTGRYRHPCRIRLHAVEALTIQTLRGRTPNPD